MSEPRAGCAPLEGLEHERPRDAARGVEPERPRAHALRAWAGRNILRASSHCPLRGLHALARCVGRLGSHLPVRASRIARANVALCFPTLSARERRDFVRASLEEAACMASELGHLWLRPVAEVLARVQEVLGEEHLTQALQRGRGVLLASPHLGAWELSGLWFASRYPMTTLYREPRVRAMGPVYAAARCRSGAQLFPAGSAGVRALHRALRRNEVAALLPDQDPGQGAGVFAPFFGVPANTSTLVPRIAQRSQATVLFTFAERLARGAGYRIHIRPGSETLKGADLERGAQALNEDIEACVRMAPLQYLWTYKRFRVRPAGAGSLYRSAQS